METGYIPGKQCIYNISPEMKITTEQLSPAFTKHHVDGLGFDCSFNVFTEPDTGYPHDHPFDFVTHIISGGYIEEVYIDGKPVLFHRLPGTCHYVKATDIHRVVGLPNGCCTTVMVPQSGHVRTSGVYEFKDGKTYYRTWNEDEFKEVKI